jgi:two-component system sensor kinase FixL
VLDAVVDAIITIDDKGIIQSLNRATVRLFGYHTNELLGKPVSYLMPEPYRSRHQQYIEHYLSTHEAKIINIGRELVGLHKDGSTFPIYLAVSEIHTPQGSFFAGIVRDLTEQKEAQESLLEQRERLAKVGRLTTMGEMTASIAHEINQPLTAIALYAQACLKLLEKRDFDHDKVTNALKKLNAQSLRAGDVIEGIQRFVRHEGSEKQAVNLNQLIRELEHLASSDARMHGIELSLDLEQRSLIVFCDGVQIQQVALNLIRNAIDAMREIDCRNGNVVVIRSRNLSGYAEISVIDSGTGIGDAETAKIFGAFHTTKAEGMGMGLSICRSIVQDHGGEMGFRNNPEHGCTFHFRLPQGDWHD